MNLYKAIAPSQWAGYLINGEPGEMSATEVSACDAWITSLGFGRPISCDDAGFSWRHDAFAFWPYADDCQEYAFVERK